MSPERKTRFALIGCGGIHSAHAMAMKAIEEAQLVVVCDVIEQRMKKSAETYGCEGCLDYHDLLSRKDIDAFDVVTPSGIHAAIGIDAARAGKHVFVTKPIDVALPAIDALIEECARSRVALAVMHQFRSYPSYLALKKAVDEGRLGKLLLAVNMLRWYRSQAYFDDSGWRGTWKMDGGGAMMNQNVHYVDLLQWIVGDVESVTAHTATRTHKIETEDVCTVSLRFRNGCLGAIAASTSTYKGLPATLEVHGDKGNVSIAGDRIVSWQVEGEAEPPSEEGPSVTAVADPQAGMSEGVKAHMAQIRSFISAIEGKGQPVVSGPEARKAVEINLAVYRSSQTGRAVHLPLSPI
jgi:predicted dehydrogenase